MRILLDENVPVDFARLLPGHDVVTVSGLGWAGVSNGELLARALGVCEVFVTLDQSWITSRATTQFYVGEGLRRDEAAHL